MSCGNRVEVGGEVVFHHSSCCKSHRKHIERLDAEIKLLRVQIMVAAFVAGFTVAVVVALAL